MEIISFEFLFFIAFGGALYYIFPKRLRWTVLLFLSCMFYTTYSHAFLPYIFVTWVSSYIVTCAIERTRKKVFLILGLVLNFGILLTVKLSDGSMLLPLGISFYTFQVTGYIIDVWQKKVRPEKNILKLALFISFFPQLIQGPISRFGELREQLFTPHSPNAKMIFCGVLRISWGFFKKLVIADRVAIATSEIVRGELRGAYILCLMIIYSVQIYADFTGGMDIAIGTAYIFGIRLHENFNYPFASTTLKEYWRRWHITLGEWFSDYVFFPLSISKPMQKISKYCRKKFGTNIGKKIPVYTALTITWFLTGFWHGARMNFIVWGLLNGTLILISQELQPIYGRLNDKFYRLLNSRPWDIFRRVRTFIIIGSIRMLDLYRDVPFIFSGFFSIFYDVRSWSDILTFGTERLGMGGLDFFVICASIVLIYTVSKVLQNKPFCEKIISSPACICACISILFSATALLGVYGVGFDSSRFIYNQF